MQSIGRHWRLHISSSFVINGVVVAYLEGSMVE